jgi:GNAT superfamily N-acetyltransferase
MLSISSSQVTPQLTSLFDSQAPVGLRCFAVLAGIDPGKIVTDDLHQPNWAVVWEPGDGVLYVGGTLDASTLESLVSSFRHDGEVLIGFWSRDDPMVRILPLNHTWEGSSLDFFDRPADSFDLDRFLRQLPPGHTIRPIDQSLLERCLWYEDTVRRHGSVQAFLEQGLGFCLTQGDHILSEAYAGKVVMGTRELGAITKEEFRGRGLATITCAQLIKVCEKTGARTYWNCGASNLASVAVARKLGYRTERGFQWRAWSQLSVE